MSGRADGAGAALLRRFLESGPSARAGERCELCGASIPDDHSHVVALETRALMCACRACYLLFTHEGAARGRYRAVPDRYLIARDVRLTEARWDELQIPVGIAFFFHNSSLGRMVAFYPGPAGAAESLLPLATWREVVRDSPLFATLAPDVEALLVRRRRNAAGGGQGFECYVVPIDACYELVGRLRRQWRGFDGGEEARREIDGFFAGVRARSGEPDARPADAGHPAAGGAP